MGGGVITKRGRGLVLLAVIPFPEESAKETLAEIKEEFPDLEYKYIFQQFQSFAGSPVHVPAGNYASRPHVTPCPANPTAYEMSPPPPF